MAVRNVYLSNLSGIANKYNNHLMYSMLFVFIFLLNLKKRDVLILVESDLFAEK